MNRNIKTPAVLGAMATSFLFGCSSEKITDRTDPTRPSTVQVSEGYDTLGRKWGDQTNQPAKPEVLSRDDAVLLHFAGTITDIDYADREVTLKDSQGQSETFVVDTRVQRLNEAKVGDKVSVDYYLGINAEIRKPTAEEAQNPLVVVEAAGKAGAQATPAAHGSRQIRAVVTIESMDRSAKPSPSKGPAESTSLRGWLIRPGSTKCISATLSC
jgi:hypothetical protein